MGVRGAAPILTRRRLLVLGAVALAAGVVAIAVPAFRTLWPAPVDRLTSRLRWLFPELAAAAAAMRRASWVPATGDDRPALVRPLFGTDIDAAVAMPPQALLAALGRAVDRDFENGRLAVIDGWYLAETEVLLMAFMTASTA
jgi:hypothetical protein